ncbi:hypothetical protein AC623_18195 [Bacillus sp. FJAT-27231]|nr:hypothetical protein AC623_18195 [Bacillus sp. FJAT-27231]
MEVVSPEEDERIHVVLTKLASGMDRDALAKELNYASYKSMDMYMRRKGYRFDTRSKNYIPQLEEVSVAIDTSKASRIVQLLANMPDDPLLVCSKTGFRDMQEMGQYMKTKGYKWNTEKSNYEKDPQLNDPKHRSDVLPTEDAQEIIEMSSQPELSIAPYLPLLKMLKHNEERLTELLIPYGKGCSIPRYTIEGLAQTKTVQMIHTLSTMVTDFAKEKNISQRDVFEVALIDFFRKYGYEKEVAQLLKIR